jgi:hypothetical protein
MSAETIRVLLKLLLMLERSLIKSRQLFVKARQIYTVSCFEAAYNLKFHKGKFIKLLFCDLFKFSY